MCILKSQTNFIIVEKVSYKYFEMKIFNVLRGSLFIIFCIILTISKKDCISKYGITPVGFPLKITFKWQ